jgi:exodeoxyribonuclease-3
MKLLSWNANGLRALLREGSLPQIANDADFVCLQETQANESIPLLLPNYNAEWAFSSRPGYAGVASLFKKKPVAVTRGLGVEKLDGEGRVLTLKYPSFYLVNTYVPQSQGGLERWYYRIDFDAALAELAEKLLLQKPVILCGDFNVAHGYIDIYPENTRNFENSPGFKEEERGAFDNLLSLGFVDAFRMFHPDERAYTWWGRRRGHKEQNRGRRIDYFLVTENIADLAVASDIISDFTGSDHAPITLEVRL